MIALKPNKIASVACLKNDVKTNDSVIMDKP